MDFGTSDYLDNGSGADVYSELGSGTDDFLDIGSGEELIIAKSASTASVFGAPSFRQPIGDDADRIRTLSMLFVLITAFMIAFVVIVTMLVWKRRRSGSLHLGRSASPPIIEAFPRSEP
ncbi:hypothetical protein Tcan_08138 [Toxocara canis]|uniref:Uncharacterized protein n=2 Tax=Toxocara canis TaxID=6265 RepID=A0A0B2VXA8_TOXCA|nr:hypothetical protein Tcan_08138 [Toxocara canis]VDM43375.1 unnamed protein product [Toxocara canis]